MRCVKDIIKIPKGIEELMAKRGRLSKHTVAEEHIRIDKFASISQSLINLQFDNIALTLLEDHNALALEKEKLISDIIEN